jgi:hypothetical protein
MSGDRLQDLIQSENFLQANKVEAKEKCSPKASLKTLAILIATEIWRQITLKTVPSFQIY